MIECVYKNVRTHDIEAPSQVCVWGGREGNGMCQCMVVYEGFLIVSDVSHAFCGTHMSHRVSTRVVDR